MAIGFLIFYGIAAAIILGGGFVVFWFLRRRSMVLAVILSLLSVPALVLVWPIPIHGGFMLLGEAILDEWSRDRAQEEHIRVDQKKQEYLDKLGGRFQGELAIVQSHPHSRGWQKIVDAESHTAWLATASGMVWSQWLELTATATDACIGQTALRRILACRFLGAAHRGGTRTHVAGRWIGRPANDRNWQRFLHGGCRFSDGDARISCDRWRQLPSSRCTAVFSSLRGTWPEWSRTRIHSERHSTRRLESISAVQVFVEFLTLIEQ